MRLGWPHGAETTRTPHSPPGRHAPKPHEGLGVRDRHIKSQERHCTGPREGIPTTPQHARLASHGTTRMHIPHDTLHTAWLPLFLSQQEDTREWRGEEKRAPLAKGREGKRGEGNTLLRAYRGACPPNPNSEAWLVNLPPPPRYQQEGTTGRRG